MLKGMLKRNGSLENYRLIKSLVKKSDMAEFHFSTKEYFTFKKWNRTCRIHGIDKCGKQTVSVISERDALQMIFVKMSIFGNCVSNAIVKQDGEGRLVHF